MQIRKDQQLSIKLRETPPPTPPAGKGEGEGAGRGLTDQDSTAENSGPPTAQTAIEHNWQRFVRDNITEQKSDENPMFSALEEAEDLSGMISLGAFTRLFNDLEIDFVLAHQPARQSEC